MKSNPEPVENIMKKNRQEFALQDWGKTTRSGSLCIISN
jgi:hypothetical protein